MTNQFNCMLAVGMLLLLAAWLPESAFAGYLYGMDAGRSDLYKINPTNGDFTQIRNQVIPVIDGLAYIPEPAKLALLGLGGLVLVHRRRK